MGNIFCTNNNSNAHLLERIQAMEEQIRELEANRVPLITPWRDIGYNGFSKQTKNQLLGKIGEIDPPCDAINLIVIGELASGKSAYVNTLKTVLRNSGQITTPQSTYGIMYASGTTRFSEVTLKTYDGSKKLRIYDCPGFHPNSVSLFHDLEMAIRGHVKRNYEFQKYLKIDEWNDFYNRNPTINDQMHCIVFVADVKALNYPNIRRMKNQVANLNIPSRLILTKVDTLDLCNAGSLNEIFQSRQAEKKVNDAKNIFNFQDCEIWPVANYVKGITQNITQDVLALLSLDNILEEAITYIENQL